MQNLLFVIAALPLVEMLDTIAVNNRTTEGQPVKKDEIHKRRVRRWSPFGPPFGGTFFPPHAPQFPEFSELRRFRRQFGLQFGGPPDIPPLGPNFGIDGDGPRRRGPPRHFLHRRHEPFLNQEPLDSFGPRGPGRHGPGPRGPGPRGPGPHGPRGPGPHGFGPRGPGPHGPGPRGPGPHGHGPPGPGPYGPGPRGPRGPGPHGPYGPGPHRPLGPDRFDPPRHGPHLPEPGFPNRGIIGHDGPTFASGSQNDGAPPQAITSNDSNGQYEQPENTVLRYQSSCGLSTTSRIVGGEEVKKDDFSWTVALMRPSRGGYEHFCGATIISDMHLLTAAHCVSSIKSADVRIRVGVANLDNGSTDNDLRVEKITKHPKFNSTNYHNDIAVVKLKKAIVFNPQLQPCCLPELIDHSGQNGIVVGWGTTSFGGPSSSVLQQVTLPIWSNNECKQKISVPVNDRMLCAGLRSEGGHDACQGDSGGPLLVRTSTNRWSIGGIVSYGFKCAQKGVPGVYTRVSKFNEWIIRTAV